MTMAMTDRPPTPWYRQGSRFEARGYWYVQRSRPGIYLLITPSGNLHFGGTREALERWARERNQLDGLEARQLVWE